LRNVNVEDPIIQIDGEEGTYIQNDNIDIIENGLE